MADDKTRRGAGGRRSPRAPAKSATSTTTSRPRREPISALVEAPGVRPATFKLVEKGPDSFDLFRSSRKIGTARIEENGEWTARFEAAGKRWTAVAESAADLLHYVGAYLLLGEARKEAERPLEEVDPNLRVTGKINADQKLSIAFAHRTQERRIEKLDELIGLLGKHIKPMPKG
jgi:hypothetical protein